MIERTILLHEEYNVFNGAQVGPGRPCGGRFFDSANFGAPLGQESAPESQAAAKKLSAIKRRPISGDRRDTVHVVIRMIVRLLSLAGSEVPNKSERR